MGAPTLQLTLFNDAPIIDAYSPEQSLCFIYTWDLQIIKTGANGNPLFTIQCSNDGDNWDNYHADATDYELQDNSVSFIDDVFPARFMRVQMKANGTTAGTVKAILNIRKFTG